MKKAVKISLLAGLVVALGAAGIYTAVSGSPLTEASVNAADLDAALSNAVAIAQKAAGYTSESNGVTVITLSDDGITVKGTNASVDDGIITINAGGYYYITGSISEGQIHVLDNVKTKPVVLIMAGVSVTNSDDPALWIEDAEETMIYLADDTENSFVSGSEAEQAAVEDTSETDEDTTEADDDSSETNDDASGAAIYSKDNLYIAGTGSLTANGYINNGIATTDNLLILDGSINVTAVNNGLKGNDAVVINGGYVNVSSDGDGIQSDTELIVNDGVINITTGGRADSADSGSEGFGGGDFGSESPSGESPGGEGFDDEGFGNMGGMQPPANDDENITDTNETQEQTDEDKHPSGTDRKHAANSEDQPESSHGLGGSGSDGQDRMNFGNKNDHDSESNSSSMKGLKSGEDLQINGGTITIDSADDAIHSDGNVTISGGTLIISSDDDGIHADDTTTIEAGNITIDQAYEGIEGYTIQVNGGTISVTSSDDGFNAGGTSSGTEIPLLVFNDGEIFVNASGDGLDSNGDLIVNGGYIIVDGPSSSANGALDSGTESGGVLQINGGTVLAIGASGMAETFDSDSTQYSFKTNTSGEADSNITITDETGNVLIEYEAAKSFDSVVFSCPELTQDETITVTVDDTSSEITLTDISTGESSGMNSGGGMNHGSGMNHGDGTNPGGRMNPGGSMKNTPSEDSSKSE